MYWDAQTERGQLGAETCHDMPSMSLTTSGWSWCIPLPQRAACPVEVKGRSVRLCSHKRRLLFSVHKWSQINLCPSIFALIYLLAIDKSTWYPRL